MENALIALVTAGVAGLLLMPRLARSRMWRATITPLASIIGSGFLVLGPILNVSYGYLAPLVMALLCLVAYLFGSAIRFNISRLDAEGAARPRTETEIEDAASWVLAVAYFISVAYYLNLFGSFGVSLTPFDDTRYARLLTSAMLLLILAVGWLRGFSALERLEQVSVGIKLAIIAGLLVGLCWYFHDRATGASLVFAPPTLTPVASVTLAFGLLITVQGFETSRYLRDHYDAATRIRSMKLAQWLSAAIYMAYILLIAFVFRANGVALTETAIIDMMRVVAPVLPAMLVVAALAAQLSAAVADTNGSGGLVEELSRGRIPARGAYSLLVAVGLLLTWTANVFEIISYASRAFALYYALQSLIAALAARRTGRHGRAGLYLGLAFLGLMAVLFGTPAE
ncbi:hypothetical protein [Emcibacter sp. SYSU 3D8]|uniref:hypothetical protein n=1 Tax=Emcibacter sp. SYSU 3D8 TaxID=3133969 RepID=UPI0031FEFEAB